MQIIYIRRIVYNETRFLIVIIHFKSGHNFTNLLLIEEMYFDIYYDENYRSAKITI
jgi:hypothetical protein